ncbi:MAG: hypothetical protein ACRDBM_09480 [Sporomusa sp.]
MLTGYYYAVKNYFHTAKGYHDIVDYTQAAVIIAGVSIIIGLIITVAELVFPIVRHLL